MPVLRVVGPLALTNAGDNLELVFFTLCRDLNRVSIIVLGSVRVNPVRNPDIYALAAAILNTPDEHRKARLRIRIIASLIPARRTVVVVIASLIMKLKRAGPRHLPSGVRERA